jgi:tetratricopeptide (TPR) repeat protein
MSWLGRAIRFVRGDSTAADEARLHRQLAASMTHARASECAASAELALHRRDTAGAVRAIARGLALEPTHAHLLELKARIELIHDRPGRAMDILQRLEGTGRRDDRVRLLIQLARCRTGEMDAAMLELTAWSRQEDCPAEARVLLAALQQGRGELEAARRTLQQNMARGPDVMTCQAMVVLEVRENLPASAHKAAGYLAHAFIDEAFSARFLASLRLTPRQAATHAPPEMVEQLAAQLLHKPGVIATLVAAQKLEPNAGRIELLRRALGRIAESAADGLAVAEAMAELAELAGDVQEARRWAKRGLRLAPFSASLALLLDRVGSGSPIEQDIQSLDALRKAAKARPSYADVRSALIRRYQAAGYHRLARRAAERWIAEQPEHPLARAAWAELEQAA